MSDQASREPTILGIESSCDETACAVVVGATRVLSNVVATQHDLHERYAGVVPEIASRAHLERIMPVVREALDRAGVAASELDAIAVGHRPGLIGSLLVGVSSAKTLAWALDRPLIGVNHILAHLHAPLLDDGAGSRAPDPPAWPALGLVVSGGHTSLYHATDPLAWESIGRTIDDAIGEAYDKAATILRVGYPGGPRLDALAQRGDDRAHDLPVAGLDRESLDFSFSGLKTALLYTVCGQPRGRGAEARFPRSADDLDDTARADFAASFQRAAVTAITRKLLRGLERYPDTRTLLVGGGVSANSRLRSDLTALAAKHDLDLRLSPLPYCLDNAAMIAGLAAHRYELGDFDDLTLTAHPS
ncbi:MAG: tRNA (adenosine(37)-N6)-threonylcarbamoyltransferase complex transferase subunit TsaD [Planctomycetes bacterium]|nr:tRNA (adenosine(37)-N6)-threonylcarbamoyltransferase complex transferase subunit TsaD [Planctomycetota bacterium]